ncbi:MAG TPA: terminase large subunit [Paracoccus solventivorans]|uniref:Terminase large subunit n=1 Tax=Paracoccus solventivorans TaxID=53463 RepID=A0A832PMW8_9RHOB|nr:terminase TerL endonuclease subunit [Paracoccus solventivorans]HHW34333.1 terminase large subunit [Paracoccus solventivorans]
MATSTYPAWIHDGSDIPDPFGDGERAVQFLRSLRHPLSSAPGCAFELDPWQERIVRRIYGPRHPDGSRIVREVWLQVPRGNRKTSIAAALALLHTLGPERVPAGQIIFAAADRAQAGIAFKETAGIVRMDKRLLAATTIYDPQAGLKSIRSKRDGSELKAVSSDGKAQHGSTPSFVLADEIHVWQGRDLWEALRSGMVKRPGGLWVTATTAGRGREGLAAERYNYMSKIARGEIEDETVLPIIFEPEKGDDWLDEAVWHKVNPGLIHGYPVLSEMRNKAKEAKNNPSEAYSFRQYNLNEWLGNSRDPLFDFDTYDALKLKKPSEEVDLEQLPCYLGVDYAQSGDLAAIVAAWRHNDGRIEIKPWFFVPEEGLDERARLEDLPYREWIEQGHIIAVPGPVISREAVQEKIAEIAATYQVEQIAYDPWQFRVAATELAADGLPMLEMRQGPATMGPANGELIRAVNGRVLRHDGHPVLRNHFANVAAKTNDTGMVWMTKADKKRGHIDGAVAASMAVSRAVAAENTKSRYEDPDVLGLLMLP